MRGVGTIKIAEGIYSYTPEFSVMNSNNITIPTISGFGTITQPANYNNIIVDSGHNYLALRSSKQIRVNFVRGTTSIFTYNNFYNWPQIGGSSSTIYYIDADYYSIQRAVPYQLQCMSSISSPRTNVALEIWSYYNS